MRKESFVNTTPDFKLCSGDDITKKMITNINFNYQNIFGETPFMLLCKYNKQLVKHAIFTFKLNKNYIIPKNLEKENYYYKLYCENKLIVSPKNAKYMCKNDIIKCLLIILKKIKIKLSIFIVLEIVKLSI